MSLSPSLQRLLDSLPEGGLDFQQLLVSIYQTRFTGPLTIDFLNGTPKQINLGQPVKLTICAASNGSPLDKGKPPGAGF